MGRKKITISHIVDERNRQVHIQFIYQLHVRVSEMLIAVGRLISTGIMSLCDERCAEACSVDFELI